MKLIDADKIGLTDFEIILCEGSYKNALENLLEKISNAPTVELPPAQPEIIRCKYCKHRHEAECPMYHEEYFEWDDDGYIEYETIYHDFTEDDGYCDKGERREA